MYDWGLLDTILLGLAAGVVVNLWLTAALETFKKGGKENECPN